MKKILTMGLITLLCSMFGCAKEQAYKSVDVEAFAELIADTTITILDVRTPEEYIDGHIAQAKNIDVQAKDFEENLSMLSTTHPVAVYCRSGRRSKMAAEILARKGFQVTELNPGFMGWISAGKPVEREK